jgi:ABC-type polysaccharide/polyol phosphate export permease
MTRGRSGNLGFLLWNLVVKDFKVRYRNMSLGVFWSLASPLVMMVVLTFVFTQLLPTDPGHPFPLFVLCGLVPFSFFTLAWQTGTTSLVDNAGLVKRMSLPREAIPISTVLANALHLGIQLVLLLGMAWAFGSAPAWSWLWLLPIVALEVIFVTGLALLFSPVDVYLRDTRYVVESANLVLFWLIPIVYPFSVIPDPYRDLYQYNPLAAVVFAFRNVLLEGQAPATSLLLRLVLVSFAVLAAGLLAFGRLKRRIYDYL